ncbi:uncharacterized protein G2W53_039811 [Senna tora]|uniref:Uncharacterized protein n=1 Tax=Senna tora TaxID=362788 RepID=A0A834W358_9FABA|nr:uncharacterized protein G2W53_039811 [Senna tora]
MSLLHCLTAHGLQTSPSPFMFSSVFLTLTSIALQSRPRLSPFDHEQRLNITFIPNSTILDAFSWSCRKPSSLFRSIANLKFSLGLRQRGEGFCCLSKTDLLSASATPSSLQLIEAVVAALVKATLRTLPSLHWDLMAKLPTSEIASTIKEFRSRDLAELAEMSRDFQVCV